MEENIYLIKISCFHNFTNYKKYNLRRISTYHDGTLVLRDAQKTDSGNYTCKVSNTYGEDQITYYLLVQGVFKFSYT